LRGEGLKEGDEGIESHRCHVDVGLGAHFYSVDLSDHDMKKGYPPGIV